MRELTDEAGYSPSIREIAETVALSASTVASHLQALEHRGLVTPPTPRTAAAPTRYATRDVGYLTAPRPRASCRAQAGPGHRSGRDPVYGKDQRLPGNPGRARTAPTAARGPAPPRCTCSEPATERRPVPHLRPERDTLLARTLCTFSPPPPRRPAETAHPTLPGTTPRAAPLSEHPHACDLLVPPGTVALWQI